MKIEIENRTVEYVNIKDTCKRFIRCNELQFRDKIENGKIPVVMRKKKRGYYILISETDLSVLIDILLGMVQHDITDSR